MSTVTLPEVDTSIVKKSQADLESQVSAIKIMDEEAYEYGAQLLKDASALKKEAESVFADAVKKAHELHKDLLAQKKKLVAPIAKAETLLKKKLNDYRTEQERIRREKEAAALAESQALADLGMEELATEIELPKEAPKHGISQVTTWKFKITDEAAIPRDFLVPDMQAIGAWVRARKDKANIPGVEVYAETSVR